MVGTSTSGPGGPNDEDGGRSRFFGRRSALKSPSEAIRPEAAPAPPAALPPPKRPRRRGISGLSSFLTFLLVLFFALGYAAVVGERRLRAPGPLAADKVVYVAPLSDVPEIIAKLESEGVIDDGWTMQGAVSLMQIASRMAGAPKTLKAGEYLFKQHASLRDAIDVLVLGRSILHSFTVPEGWTSQMALARLREQDALLVGDVKDAPPEGTLMPDTYKFARGEKLSAQIDKMKKAQSAALASIWAGRAPNLPLKSPAELVILASIVEKETGKADERPHVAGVFVNRIAKGMRLQSDPTIVYGLVGGKGTLGHPITRAELDQTPNPYNTYKIPGLPPGPIANPGRAAMEAVANPTVTSDLYFVADGTGGHVFADTLDQHNRNVQKWRQIEKDAKDKLAPDAAAPAALPGKPGEQRGDAAPAVPSFGAMPAAFAATAEAASPAAEAARRLAAAARAEPAAQAPFSLGPGFDEMGIKIRGLDDVVAAAARNGIDGAPGDDISGEANPALVPVSPLRRADQKARAARFGLGSLPESAPQAAIAAPAAPPAPPQPAVAAAPRPRAFDASEGTGIDPLRNRTYDLSFSKTVPGNGIGGAARDDDSGESAPAFAPPPPVRRADQKARAARVGPGSLPASVPQAALPAPAPLQAAAVPAPPQPVAAVAPRRRAPEASDSTGADSPRNRNFDLSTSKIVPSFD